MFDLGWDEMAVIAVVALVVLGPKELPNALRTVTGLMKQARKLANEFQNGVHEIIREAELEDAKKAIADLKQGDIAGAIEKHLDADGEIKSALQTPLEEAVNPAAITEGAVAANSIAAPSIVTGAGIVTQAGIATAEAGEGAAAAADTEINPAVAAYAPGGSATQLPEFAHEDALGSSPEFASEAAPLIEGDPTSTPVETTALKFGHEDELRDATVSDLAKMDEGAESKIGSEKEKSKIS
jgi:sec-independent protein translocase protein TatB